MGKGCLGRIFQKIMEYLGTWTGVPSHCGIWLGWRVILVEVNP